MPLLVGRELIGIDHRVVVGRSIDALVCGRVLLGLGSFVRAGIALWLTVTDYEGHVGLSLIFFDRMRQQLIVIVIVLPGEFFFCVYALAFARLYR